MQIESVKVEIYYETLNEVVRKFFVEQLTPESISHIEHVELKLYPYGNTEKHEDHHHTCPAGDLQCKANKIHVC